MVRALADCLFCGPLGCEGSALAGAAEPRGAGAGSRHHVALKVRQGDDGIVKGGMDVGR